MALSRDDRTSSTDQHARIDAFVARHFGLRGTWGLHRHALGWDLLRAPANVALAPVFLVVRLLALLVSLAGLKRSGRWLADRRILLRSSVARVVAAVVREELIADLAPLSARQSRLVEDYAAVRSAVSEILTTALVLVLGAALFRIATPGVISLAPVLTEYAARSAALAEFPLGRRLGGLWYGVFPIELPIWYIVLVGFGLAMVASLVTTFAGLLADPVQAALGIHRRRLLRLLSQINSQRDEAPGLAREHVLARLADITDAGLSLLRIFRP
ncbi:MAG: DUF6635 family protein [Pseudomonadota bacterium]